MISVLKRPEYSLYRHFLWADLVEILALINLDKRCSKSDFIDRFFSSKKDLVDVNDEGESDLDEGRSISPLRTEHERCKEEAYKILEARSIRYGAKYPFRLIDNDVLEVVPDSDGLLIYAYLLFAAHTAVIDNRSIRSAITSDFEIFSSKILSNYLGQNASVLTFGAGSGRFEIFSTGSIREKFQFLCKELNGEFSGKAEDPTLDQTSGDRGLDIVAHFPFEDKQDGRLIIFGQCKCSDVWSDSLFESSASSLDFVRFKSEPVPAMFMPFCYRSNTGKWFEDSKVRKTILFDRFRLITFTNFDLSTALPKSFDLLSQLVNFQEPVV